MIQRFRAKVGDDWFAVTILLIAVIITIVASVLISNFRQNEVAVEARQGIKVTAPASTKTSQPDEKTREPDENQDNQDSSGGVDVRQDGKSEVIGKFVTNLLILTGVFVLVLVAMAGSITIAIIFFQRWRLSREAKKAIPPPETDSEKSEE